MDPAPYFSVVLALGLVGVNVLWSFINVVTKTKYVCALASSDRYIVASRVLDWCQCLSALATIAIVYIYVFPKRSAPDALQHTAAVKAGSKQTRVMSVLVFTFFTLAFTVAANNSVCRSIGCVTDEAVELAKSTNRAPYINEVQKMFGGVITSMCSSRISATYFTEPTNTCPEKLEIICPGINPASVQPYRCLVYACNNQVAGNQGYYFQGVATLAVQLLICAYVYLAEPLSQHNSKTKGKQQKTSLQLSTSSDNSLNGLLYHRVRSQDTLHF